MAEGNLHRLTPEGRRPAAPSRRRLPIPANDNGAPMRERLKQGAFLLVLAAMAVSLVVL